MMNNGNPWNNPNGRTEVGLNKLIQPKCLYCEKKYSDMGKIRVHLKSHLGAKIKPYKCQLCKYKHWDKTSAQVHKMKHGKAALTADIITNIEERKRFEDQIEQDVLEIRDNQAKELQRETDGVQNMSSSEIREAYQRVYIA